MIVERPSPNHNARPVGCLIDMLLLHYTGMPSAEAALERLCDGAAEVSAHYMIDEDGTLYALVGRGTPASVVGPGSGILTAVPLALSWSIRGTNLAIAHFPKRRWRLCSTSARRYWRAIPFRPIGCWAIQTWPRRERKTPANCLIGPPCRHQASAYGLLPKMTMALFHWKHLDMM